MRRASGDLDAVLALLRQTLDRPLDMQGLDCIERATVKGLIQISSAHGVLPMLASSLSHSGVHARLEEELQVFLTEMRVRNAQRGDVLRAQLVEIGAAFAKHGLEGIVLKGGAELIAPVYPEGGRFILDLDILIDGPALEGASCILQDMGYTYVGAEEDYLHERHLPALQHPDRPAVVELHRRIGNGRWDAVLPASLIVQRSTPSSIPGICVPEPAVRYLHALVHGQVDGTPGEPEPLKLRDICELELLGRSLKPCDHAFVESRCIENGAELEYLGAMAVQAALLRDPIPANARGRQVETWASQVLTTLGSASRQRRGYLINWIARYWHRFRRDPEIRALYLSRLLKPSYLLTVFRFHRNHLQNMR